MDSREECLKQAADCREKVKTHPEQHDFWINEAMIWTERAAQARGEPKTHDVRDGKLVPKPCSPT
jgi:hypothetical protein